MKRIKNLLVLPLLLLSSCSQGNVYGKYSFRLGKESETHIGVSVELINEKVIYEGEEKGDKFVLTFDITQTSDEILDIIGNEFSGYFNVVYEQSGDYGYRLALGAKIDHASLPFLPEDFSLDVDPDIIESIIIGYINDRQITIQLPVSLDDLTYQLCWYGYYVDLESEDFFIPLEQSLLPGVKGAERFGTHPEVVRDQYNKVISSEVVTMNDTFAKEFSNTYCYDTTNTNKIGKIGKKSDNNYYYYNTSGTALSGDCVNIILRSLLEGSDETYSVNLNLNKINENEYLINTATLNASGEPFDLTTALKDPYVFRDFHDIHVGLVRE